MESPNCFYQHERAVIAPNDLNIIDAFYTDEPVIDQWTIVFNERNSFNGCHTILATDTTGFGFSQWCEGQYVPRGNNSHLGNQACLLASSALSRHVMARMHEGEQGIREEQR